MTRKLRITVLAAAVLLLCLCCVCTAEEAVKKVGMVVEGINALPAAMELSADYDVRMPISSGVNSIIKEGRDPKEVVRELMEREKKPETQRM